MGSRGILGAAKIGADRGFGVRAKVTRGGVSGPDSGSSPSLAREVEDEPDGRGPSGKEREKERREGAPGWARKGRLGRKTGPCK
jgi:hypothetical protein